MEKRASEKSIKKDKNFVDVNKNMVNLNSNRFTRIRSAYGINDDLNSVVGAAPQPQKSIKEEWLESREKLRYKIKFFDFEIFQNISAS